MTRQLPLPGWFYPEQVSQIYRVDYQERAAQARAWAREHGIGPAAVDRPRIGLLVIDAQNTFCLPEFELFVGGRTGRGAVDDNIRLCRFIYRNLGAISEITLTLDTHSALQIFHPLFWVNQQGEHPAPHSTITAEDVEAGRWRVAPGAGASLGVQQALLERHARHYVTSLQQQGKFQLTIWPFHAMLGGIGHAIVPAVEEAVFVHAVARGAQPDYQLKGSNPLTENYSALRPEVSADADGQAIAGANAGLIDKLLRCDALYVAGQAKSHCVAWTVADLLQAISARDPALARKVHLLVDCMSPVVVPGAVDFTADADAAFARFAAAGMQLVHSTDDLP